MVSISTVLMMLKKLSWLSLSLLLLLISCANAESEYSRRPCYVVVDNSVFQDITLASAMNSAAPGIFCAVQKVMKGGAEAFSFKTGNALASTQNFTAKEKRMTLVFGMNNGVIVGYSSFDPTRINAFDIECPVCFNPDAIPVKSHALVLNDKSQAVCAACHRAYNLNNGGYSEDGHRLTRYHATSSAPFGTLVVQ